MARWTRSGGSRAPSRSAPAATRPRLRWTPRARRPNGSSPTREPQETTRVAVAALHCSRRPTPRRRRSAPPARRRRTSCSGAWPPSGTSWSPSSPPPCFPGRRSRVLVPMTKVQILGRQGEVERVIGELHRLGLVEIVDARASQAVEGLGDEKPRSARRERLRLLAARTDELLAAIPPDAGADDEPPTPRPLDAGEADAELERLSPQVEALGRRLDALRDERLVLPGVSGAAPAAPAARARARRPRRRAAPRPAAGHRRTRPQHGRRADGRHASRAAGRGAGRSPASGLDARRRRQHRLPGRVPSPPSGRRARPARPGTGSPGRAAGGVRAPLAARGRGGDGAPPGGAPAGHRRRTGRARRAPAPACRSPPRPARARSPASSSGSRRSSGSARRSVRSSPSAGFPGATWRA